MTIYPILHQTRDGDAFIHSVHTTFEGARDGVHAWIRKHFREDIKSLYDEYSCDPQKGDISTEEDSITICKEELITP